MSLLLVPIRRHLYTVVMNDFQAGQQKHPLYGLGLLQNVECFENPGIAKIKNRLISAGFTPSGLPIAEVCDNYGNTYTLAQGSGSTGTIYINGTVLTNTLTN